MALVCAFTPLLLPTRGLIINIASISAIVPYVFGSVYASSKAALVSYSRTLRAELRPYGVRVMVAMAGTVRSNMGLAAKKGAAGGLPEGSLYARVAHLFEAKLGYSQREEAGPMETGEFARRLVDGVDSGEGGWLGGLVGGRPDWFWCGGQARLVYWGSWLGEWAMNFVVWRRFRLWELEAIVKADEGVGEGKKSV